MSSATDRRWILVVPDDFISSGRAWPRRWALSRVLDRGISRDLGIRRPIDVIGWAITGHASALTEWPPGPVCWRAEFDSEAPLGALRMDPVNLSAGPRGLCVSPPATLGVTEHEAVRIVRAVTESLEGGALGLRMGSAQRWYGALPDVPDGAWWAPQEIAGQPVLDYLPAGDSGAGVRKLLNEIQVILHQAPENLSRRERGVAEINSVWPWGWAARGLTRVGAQVAHAHSEDPYAVGLSTLAGVDHRSDVGGPGDLDGGGVVVPDPARMSDPAWLEHRWCRPLVRALARGRIDRLGVAVGSGCLYELTRRNLRRFWRTSGRTSA